MGLGDAFDNTSPVAIALPTQNGGAFDNTSPVVEAITGLPHTGFAQLTNVVATALTTSNVSLPSSTPLTIDGVAIVSGNTIILAGQTTPSENGVYQQGVSDVLGTSAANALVKVGSIVLVQSGSANSGTWQLTNIIASAKYFRKQAEAISP